MQRRLVVALTIVGALVGATACEQSAEERALAKVWVVHVDRPNDTMPLLRGTEEGLTASAFDSAGALITTPLPFEWTSTNPDAIEVDQQGRIIAKQFGGASVFARLPNGIYGSRFLTVPDPVNLWVVNPDSGRLLVGQQRALILQSFSTPTTVPVQGWTSSNPAVATVDGKGVVTGLAPGSATISTTYANTTFRSDVYVASLPALRFSSIGASFSNSCGLTADGVTYCWGAATAGALGTTDHLDRCVQYTFFQWPGGSPPPYGSYQRTVSQCALEPVRLETPLRFTALDVQTNIACGLTSAGEAYCWGAIGALAGAQNSSPTPVLVSTQLRFSTFEFPCGVTTTNEAWCFSSPSPPGTPSSTPIASTPTQVPGGAIWKSMTGTLAPRHRCGLTIDGLVECWGSNSGGKLGTGDTLASPVPVPIQSSERFTSLDVNSDESCAIATTQLLYCWGRDRRTPVAMSTTLRFTAVSMSFNEVCAIGTDGNDYCRRADGTMAIAFGGVRYRSLATADLHSCGIREDGLTFCWGYNLAGQLGTGDNVEYKAASLVLGQ